MKKKLLVFCSYVLVSVLSTALTLWMVAGQGGVSKLDALEDLIGSYYIGEADFTALEDAAAEAMIAATGDRWSYYIPASEYAAYEEDSENAYVGIGITITKEDSGILVKEVNPGSSAMEAGIRVDDLITAIEGRSTLDMTTTDARNLVRGKEGTEVSMTILRSGETLDLSVTRRMVLVEVAKGQLLEGNVGLVTIANFDSRCAEETIAAIEALLDQGAQKLIFDVRSNPGGYATEMVKVLDYLLPEGQVFRTVDYAGRENVNTSDESCLALPMAVIVNRDSYSAAEFFAAALRDYDAAVVVGEPTSGKGHFQTTFQLGDGSAAALSIGRYYTPAGECLEGVGLQPDVEVTVDEDTFLKIYMGQLAHQEDPQLQAALDCLNQAVLAR